MRRILFHTDYPPSVFDSELASAKAEDDPNNTYLPNRRRFASFSLEFARLRKKKKINETKKMGQAGVHFRRIFNYFSIYTGSRLCNNFVCGWKRQRDNRRRGCEADACRRFKRALGAAYCKESGRTLGFQPLSGLTAKPFVTAEKTPSLGREGGRE
jgi:hypothetical protein